MCIRDRCYDRVNLVVLILVAALDKVDSIENEGPVSYTHLDVYKRQPSFRSINPSALESRIDLAQPQTVTCVSPKVSGDP